MDLTDHQKHCQKETGKPHTEVHVFLDSFSRKYRGFAHRRILHHKLGIELCVKRFGESARKPAELHILQGLGFILETWKDLEPHVFLLGEEDKEQEKDLIDLYGKEKYEAIED